MAGEGATVPSEPHGRDRTGRAAIPNAIDRSSPVPYYRQLKELLRAQVMTGRLQPGDQLDGEHVLCQRYGVSRTVVRQALADLQREAVLDRRKGQGTFVAPVRTSQSLVQSLNGLWEDVHAMDRRLRSEVRRLEAVPADAETAHRLRLAPKTSVVQLERLRFVDDEPWVHTVSHVPEAVAPDLVEQDLTDQSLYHLLRDRYGHEVMRSERVVEARSADRTLARDLHVTAGDPVLVLVNVAYDQDDVAIEAFVAFHRADRSRFEVSLTRASRGQPASPMVRLV